MALLKTSSVYSSPAAPRGGPWIEPMETRILLATYLPTLLNPQVPADAPLLPASFDKYAPPVRVQTVASTAPAIAEWTKSASPDDSLNLSGDQLSRLGGASFGTDTSFVVYGQTGTRDAVLKNATTTLLDGNTATVTLDASLPSDSMYLLWVKNATGYSNPVAINKTESWWLSTSTATRGDTVSLFGRNLAHNATDGQSWVYIKPVGKASGQWAAVTSVNPYKVDFTVPSNLANGDYEVWAHNGHGGNLGWASPIKLTIQNGKSWTGPTFNVKSFGAKGDGVTDDTAALIRASQAAQKAANSTIYLPAGTYLISSELRGNPGNTRWIGDGQDRTIIKTTPNYVAASMFYDIGTNSEVHDMTLDGSTFTQRNGALFNTRGANNVLLDHVTLKSVLSPGFYFADSTGVRLQNSTVIARGNSTRGTKQVIIDRVAFFGVTDADYFIASDATQQLSITNCTAQDYNNSSAASGDGWAQGRFFCGEAVTGSNSQIYIGDDTTLDLGVRPGFWNQNSGEQVLFELATPVSQNAVRSATTTTITIPGLTNLQKGDRIFISGGKGMGQYRTIAGFDPATGTVTLDQPWNVVPDATSTAGLGNMNDHVAVFHNHLDGKAQQVAQVAHTASTGVSIATSMADLAVDSNVITDVRYGLWDVVPNFGNNLEPIYSNLFVNNTITNTRYGAYIGGAAQNNSTGYFNNIFRDNSIDTAIEYGMMLNVDGASTRSAMANVLEHNTLRNVQIGIAFKNNPFTGLTIYANQADRGSGLFGGSIGIWDATKTHPVMIRNSWTNFQKSIYQL